jgi:multidrug resistance efflux pump
MTDQALNAAVARLERAVERIDQASRARESASSKITESCAALEQRHATLRARVQETIGRLDALIDAGTGKS